MTNSKETSVNRSRNRIIRILTYIFLAIFIILMIVELDGTNLWQNFWKIQTSRNPLTTDFIALGGVSATILNIILVYFFDFLLLFKVKPKVIGRSFFAIFMHVGFSFFGITVLNSAPIILGAYLYSRYSGRTFGDIFAPAVLAPALGPILNYLALYSNFAQPWSYFLAFAAGILMGFMSVPMSKATASLLKGYTLYNQGFASGVIALAFISLLRFYGNVPETKPLLSEGEGILIGHIFLAMSISFICVGLLYGKNKLDNYKNLILSSGYNSNFSVDFGTDLTLLNMGIMGVISYIYVWLSGGIFTGPVLGAMISVIGFAAIGKHPRNSLPVMLGVTLAYAIGGKDIGSTACLTGAFLGTALAPITGKFGYFKGLLAGFFHAVVLGNVIIVQGGMNLHNNGFSSGVVVIILLPILLWQGNITNSGTANG